MIDALFGSKTRVKLLHLFLNNPGQSFYVREITRKIDEQINSVRRELSNMLDIGIITSDSSNNKLYYQVNQRYEFYVPLKNIFGDNIDHQQSIGLVSIDKTDSTKSSKYTDILNSINGIRVAVMSGVLVKGSDSNVDILIVGDVSSVKVGAAVKDMERLEGRELNYTVLPYDEFYYRLSIRDKFITGIINGKHAVVVDKDDILVKDR